MWWLMDGWLTALQPKEALDLMASQMRCQNIPVEMQVGYFQDIQQRTVSAISLKDGVKGWSNKSSRKEKNLILTTTEASG